MAIVYTQTDTITGLCTPGVFCSGRSTNNLGGLSTKWSASDGGTPGTGTVSAVLNASATTVAEQNIQLVIASGTTGNSGTWTVRANVTTANMNITLDECHICRVNSACVNQETIGSATALAISCGATGVKTISVSGSAVTLAANDRVIIVLVFTNSAMTQQTVTFTRDQNIDSPFTAAVDNVGTVTATATVTGVSQATAVSPATVTATSVVNGVGAAQDFTTGTITIVSSVSGTGIAAIVVPGSITAQSTVSGVGQSTASGVGSINAVSVVNGISNALAVSPATVNAVSTVNGVGQSTVQTTGTITAQSTAIGAAEAAIIGTGTITAQSSVSGVGSSLFSGNVGTITAQATIAGISLAEAVSVGTVNSVSLVSGTAQSEALATGTITAQSIVSGVGDSIVAGSSVGTINAAATVNGIGAADVLATGNVVSQSVVAGVGMSIIAEQPQVGGGMWPWRWDAIDEELLRRKSREEQRRIRIQLGILPPDTEEEAELAAEELVKPDIVPPVYRRPLLDEKEFTERVMRRVREEQSRLRAERIEERNRERISRLWQEAADHELDKVVTQYRKRKAKRFDEDVLLLLS